MEEQLNEDVLAEQMEAQAEAEAEQEAKDAKKNQKRWYIVHTYSGYENKVKSKPGKNVLNT